MLKVLKDLGVALLNATLILLALCLFLAWKVTSTADDIAENFARNLVTIEPLRADLQAATNELSALRQDVAQISTQSGEVKSATLRRIETRLESMNSQVAGARDSINELATAPARLMDHAIETAADSLADKAMSIRGCVPPQS